MATSLITKSQLIAKLCVRRKEWERTRAQALLTGDTRMVQVAGNHIGSLTEQISDLHLPAYIVKEKVIR